MNEEQGERRGRRPRPQPQSAQLPFMGRLLVSADLTSDRTSATGGCPRFALLGCKVHPRPRLLRICRNLLSRQLAAAATRTQRTVSGQASFAGRAVRKAHSESQADRPENECIHFPAGFLAFFCPETCLTCFKLQAQIVCFCFQAGSPGWVQGAKSPGAGFQGLHRPLTFFPSKVLNAIPYKTITAPRKR